MINVMYCVIVVTFQNMIVFACGEALAATEGERKPDPEDEGAKD